MPQPSYNSVLEYVVEVEAEIRKATSGWKAFGYAASQAYSQAYNEQGNVLREINKSLMEAREREEKIMSLALTILTVGVAGPVVAGKLKEVFEKGGEVVKDAVVDLGKKGIEASTEWAKKSFEPPSFGEAFKPAGIPPDQYGDELQETIEVQTSILEDNVLGFMKQGSAGMTMDGARRLSEAILNSDFIKNPPRLTDRNRLKKYASLVLWLAWAWARDVKYWEIHSLPAMFLGELQSFEPLRKVLREQLRVDPSVEQDAFDPRRGASKVINMDGFIQWSWSPSASRTLFAGMPAHPQGRIYAEMQMQQHMINMTFQRMGFIADDD